MIGTDLSVVEAARASGEDAALVAADGTTLTWNDVADALEEAPTAPAEAVVQPFGLRPRLLRAERTVESVVDAFRAIADGVPAFLLDPSTTPEEWARWGRIVARIPVDPDWTRPRAGTTPSARPLWIVPTSGSTARPRAVVLSRGAVVAAARASAENLGRFPGDRWLLCLPPSHVGGASVLVRMLLARGTVVLSGRGRFEGDEVLDQIRRERVTLVSLVPTQLRRLLEAGGDARAPASLRAVLVGGAAATDDLVRRARERGWPVLLTWGMTETGGQFATQVYGEADPPGPPDAGRVLGEGALRIASDGRIAVRGPTLFSGTLAEEGFVPRRDRGGWFLTEDLGSFEDGRLRVLGRADVTILSGGEKVQPREIEKVLKEHPEVAEACVVGVPDPEWGEKVVAAVEAPGADPGALIDWCRSRWTGGRVPKEIRCLDALPTTPSGKVDRRAVVRIFQ